VHMRFIPSLLYRWSGLSGLVRLRTKLFLYAGELDANHECFFCYEKLDAALVVFSVRSSL
jgi:hypothetical protein